MPNGRFLASSRRILVGAAALACGGIVSLGMIRQARSADDDFAALRDAMVRRQIERRGVRQASVLEAMARVPRHRFVPEKIAARAYEDRPLSIGHGQTISQPYIVGLMTELLAIDGHERVLEIGTGSGYQAAILAEVAAQVYTIEILEPLAEAARKLLSEMAYDNVEVRHGDGYVGWPDEAPFDCIILTAAPPEIPQPLLDQLALGGRLVAPVGDLNQELVLVTKEADGVTRTSVLPVRFVPMTGKAQE